MNEFVVGTLQWVKMHLRLAALERGGRRLIYRFDFPGDAAANITCRVYFTDEESTPMSGESQESQMEIHRGWVSIGMSTIRRGLEAADLPQGFTWKPTVHFVLHQNAGMGSRVVGEFDEVFTWPVDNDE